MATNMGIPVSKKIIVPVTRVEDAPENLYLPKAEFVKKRKAMREARLKADEAYKKTMAEALGSKATDDKLKDVDMKVRKQRQLVSTLHTQLNGLEGDMKEAQPTELKDIKKEIKKVQGKIEIAEEKLLEVEAEYEKVKSEE